MNEKLPPSLDTWTTFFLLAAAQGIFLAITLYLHKNGNRKANVLLGTFILLFAITLIDYVGFWTRYNIYFSAVRGIYAYIVFLFGPLLFLYLKRIYGEKSGNAECLHFLFPVAFFILNKIGWRHWFPSMEGFAILLAALIVAHLTVYGILSAALFRKRLESSEEGKENFIRQRWHRMLLGLYGGFILGWMVYYLLIRTPYFTLFYDYSISLAMTVFIYTVGYLGYRQPEIFSGMAMRKVFIPTKYQNSSLTPLAAQSLLEKLLSYMKEEKPYLDNELRLASLAEKLDVSIHHLSQVINEQMQKSFPDFVNEYRVGAAKEMLANPKFAGTYIIDVAYSVGFNNKTSFNKIFKQNTGFSPTEYRNQNLILRQNGAHIAHD